MTELPATVFIVDDDEAVRASMLLLMKSLGLPARAFVSANDFLADFDPNRPGCLVLDMRMPGMSGLELQEVLNERGGVLPIIFVTGHGDIPLAVEAMQHGAMDFLQKPFRDQDLIDRIHKAVEKDRAGRELLGSRERVRARLTQLTPREQQVLAMVTQGKSNKVIAGDLDLSERTVEIHRAHVMQKMAANSLAHLVRMVIDAGEPAPAGPATQRLR
jgi:two-component system, LuxR family, response regulator FixJ